MSKYLNTTLIFIGVWIVSSLLNGIFSGVSILIFEGNAFNASAGTVLLACIFSFACSIPMVALVWLVTVIAIACGKYGHDLFQIILTAALFCALIGAIFFLLTFGKEFNAAKYWIALSINITAISGILAFRHKLKLINHA